MKSLQAIALFVSKSNRQSQTEADGINDSNIYSSAIAIDSAMDPACAEASRLSSTMAALSSIGGLFVFLSNLLATRHRICVCTIMRLY